MDNFALDFCVDKNKNIIPFDITVPYAKDIYATDSLQAKEAAIDH